MKSACVSKVAVFFIFSVMLLSHKESLAHDSLGVDKAIIKIFVPTVKDSIAKYNSNTIEYNNDSCTTTEKNYKSSAFQGATFLLDNGNRTLEYVTERERIVFYYTIEFSKYLYLKDAKGNVITYGEIAVGEGNMPQIILKEKNSSCVRCIIHFKKVK